MDLNFNLFIIYAQQAITKVLDLFKGWDIAVGGATFTVFDLLVVMFGFEIIFHALTGYQAGDDE